MLAPALAMNLLCMSLNPCMLSELTVGSLGQQPTLEIV